MALYVKLHNEQIVCVAVNEFSPVLILRIINIFSFLSSDC